LIIREAGNLPSGFKEIPYIQSPPQTRSLKSKGCYRHGKAFLGLDFLVLFDHAKSTRANAKLINEKQNYSKIHNFRIMPLAVYINWYTIPWVSTHGYLQITALRFIRRQASKRCPTFNACPKCAHWKGKDATGTEKLFWG